MNLLENDITKILVDNYSVSVGHVASITDVTIDILNEGILETNPININKIHHCANIKTWQEGIIYLKNTFWIHNNRVYVCLYSPGTESIYGPTGNTKFNIILDDNHVWRYVCEIKNYISGDYVVPELNIEESIKKGCIGSVNIIDKTENQITSFANFYIQTNTLSGTGLDVVVENNQSNFTISDVLVQHGGNGYKHEDVVVITDIQHLESDNAIIDVYVDSEGKVNLSSFTNGQNYEYLDVKIIGDGTGADVTFNVIAGVLSNFEISNPGQNYTWAQAVVINSENYIIGLPELEPLNGYNSDLFRHIGPNKYIIESNVSIKQEINFYGIHRSNIDPAKYVYFDNIYFIEEFLPMEDENVTLKLILGM